MSVLDPWFDGPRFWVFAGVTWFAAINLSWPLWAIRRRRNLDLPTDETTRLVRWGGFLVCLVVSSLPIKHTWLIRLPIAALAVGLHSWPNLSVHVVRWWRQREHGGSVGVP